MKEIYGLLIFSIVILLAGYINIKKEKMKHLKSIDEFKIANEQLFSDANKFSKLFGLDSPSKDSSDNKDSSSGGTGSSGESSSISAKTELGDYGKFSEASKKNAPLIMVYGGIDVGGKKSGEYMYDYLGKIGSSANIFEAKDHKVNGKESYKAVKDKLS